MATELKLRGGTTAEHATFTGAAREVTVDTDKNTVIVHDGVTAGGTELQTNTSVNISGTTVIDENRNLKNIASVDATTLAAFNAAGVGDIEGVTAGSGLSGGGTSGTVTLSHSDTSSQASVNNSGSTFIQDITLDTYGHVTGLTSTAVSAGASTVYAGVGTYVLAATPISTGVTANSTRAGSTLVAAGFAANTGNGGSTFSINAVNGDWNTSALSGTWRAMSEHNLSNSNWRNVLLYVRIS